MEDLFIPILLGTTRQERKSENVAKLISTVGNQIEGLKTELVDPRNLQLPFDGNDDDVRDPKFTEITNKADGFFITVPEYNHSFPGTLKRMLDSELKNYIHKPVALAGVSSGMMGGVRAIESLIPVLRELGMIVTFTDAYFPKVNDIFDKEGNLLDESHIERIKDAYTELTWMARALKQARQNIPSKYHQN